MLRITTSYRKSCEEIPVWKLSPTQIDRPLRERDVRIITARSHEIGNRISWNHHNLVLKVVDEIACIGQILCIANVEDDYHHGH